MRTYLKGLLTALVLTLAFALPGCEASDAVVALQGAALAADATAADARIQSGDVARAIMSIELADQDLSAVSAAFADYGHTRKTIETMLSSPRSALDLVGVVQAEHTRLQAAFSSLQGVVTSNWDAYTPANQAMLRLWQDYAFRLEGQYQGFVAALQGQIAGDSRRQAALQILTIVAKLAVTVA